MLPELEQLLILQDRDRKIRTLKQELHTAPLQRKELDAKMAAQSTHLETVRQKAKAVEVEKKKLEIEAQSKRDSIAKFKVQQFQTRKNEEFQALANEIKRFETEIQTIEDRELELMEDAEKLKGETAAAEKQFAQSQSQVKEQLSDLEAKVKAIESQLQQLEADRTQLTTGVDEDLLDRYNALFVNKGEAVVPLEHEVCMGCHMKITTQTAVRVKGDTEIVSCEQCGRILYRSR